MKDNTHGYSVEEIDARKKKFASNWRDYKWGVSPNFKKYNTGAILELEDDAAYIFMCGDWHMPTPDQIKELINNTTTTRIALDGVDGRSFTSKSDPSKSIFFPTTGCACNDSVIGSKDFGYVWSSVLSVDDAIGGYYLCFDSGYARLFNSYRYFGFSVRGVIG